MSSVVNFEKFSATCPRDELSAELEFATKQIRHWYANMYDTFHDSFLRREERGEVKFDKLVSRARKYFDLEECSNSEELLSAIDKRQSYFNFDGLAAIIKKCGTVDDIDMVETYEKKFWLYAKRRIYEIDTEIHGITLAGHETLIFILDEDQVMKAYKFKLELCAMLGIKKESIIISKLGSGSIVVFFQVPVKYMALFNTLPLYLDRIYFLKELHTRSYDFGDGMVPLDWKIISSVDFGDRCIVRTDDGSAEILCATMDKSECLALKYNKSFSEATADVGFTKYLNTFLSGKYKDSLPALKGVYYHKSSGATHYYPTIMVENLKTLKQISSQRDISQINQISVLSDITGLLARFECDQRLQLSVFPESILVQENLNPESVITACFCPLYGHSVHIKQASTQVQKIISVHDAQPLPLEQLQWMSNVVKLIHFQSNVTADSDLPKDHILKSMFDQKWISKEDYFRPMSFKELSEELQHLLETEKTYLQLLDISSDELIAEEDQLHLILIGHTGVGKTSLRKHLKNEPINMDESPTIVMELEFLYRESVEMVNDLPFKSVKSSNKMIYLTMWDTGGQPIFQDLLPCFARLKCMYGIVFKLPDIENFDARPIIRPCNKNSEKVTSPFSNKDILYRNLAYIKAFSSSSQQKQQTRDATSYPAAVVVGTCKDKVSLFDKQLMEKKEELEKGISSMCSENVSVYSLPVADGIKQFIHAVDNTASGCRSDRGIEFLRDNISKCAKISSRIPKSWKLFEVRLQRLCYTSHINLGIISLVDAFEIGKDCHVRNPKAALIHFHEQGIFMWYHLSKRGSMKKFVVIDPKALLDVLSRLFYYNPSCLPEDVKPLISKGIITIDFFQDLLKQRASGFNYSWFMDFLEEHHLSVKVNLSGQDICYFLPSLLPTKPDYEQALNHFNSKSISPLYIVPQSGYIATGLFTRLLTALAGVTYGSTVWRIPMTEVCSADMCRNHFEFDVNRSVIVALTEFSKFIRIDCLPYEDAEVKDTYSSIVSTLQVQLQRIVPRWLHDRTFDITVACLNEHCSVHKNHYLLPNQSIEYNQEVKCTNGEKSLVKQSQVMWFRNEMTHNSSFFIKSLKDGSLDISIASVVFIGLNSADCVNVKHIVFQEPVTSGSVQGQNVEIYFRPKDHLELRKLQYDNYREAILYSTNYDKTSSPSSIGMADSSVPSPELTVIERETSPAPREDWTTNVVLEPDVSTTSQKAIFSQGYHQGNTEKVTSNSEVNQNELNTVELVEAEDSLMLPTDFVSGERQITDILVEESAEFDYLPVHMVHHRIKGEIEIVHSFYCDSYHHIKEILKVFINNITFGILVTDSSEAFNQEELGTLKEMSTFVSKGLIVGPNHTLSADKSITVQQFSNFLTAEKDRTGQAVTFLV